MFGANQRTTNPRNDGMSLFFDDHDSLQEKNNCVDSDILDSDGYLEETDEDGFVRPQTRKYSSQPTEILTEISNENVGSDTTIFKGKESKGYAETMTNDSFHQSASPWNVGDDDMTDSPLKNYSAASDVKDQLETTVNEFKHAVRRILKELINLQEVAAAVQEQWEPILISEHEEAARLDELQAEVESVTKFGVSNSSSVALMMLHQQQQQHQKIHYHHQQHKKQPQKKPPPTCDTLGSDDIDDNSHQTF